MVATRTVGIRADIVPVETVAAEDAEAEEAEDTREMGTRGRGPLRTKHPTVQGGSAKSRRTRS